MPTHLTLTFAINFLFEWFVVARINWEVGGRVAEMHNFHKTALQLPR